jgi:hypothetical protein
MNTNKKKKENSSDEEKKFPLPVYEPMDDIYNRQKELSFEDIDDPDSIITGNDRKIAGSDLDTPGTELDDVNEAIGEEDEENNYYSVGGDDHEDLEETNADMV